MSYNDNESVNYGLAMAGRFDGHADSANGITDAYAESWRMISNGLRRDLGAHIYGQWIKPLRLGQYIAERGELVMTMPNEFTASWVRDHYADRLLLAMRALHSEIRAVRIGARELTRTESLRKGQGAAVAEENMAAQANASASRFDPRMTFANFVSGGTNNLAFSAAQRMAALETPMFSPLYLQGATGQGKCCRLRRSWRSHRSH